MNIRGFLDKLRFHIMRFMSGRNGLDSLNTGLLFLSFAMLLIAEISGWNLLTFLYYACAALFCYRALSRDLTRRRSENQRYLMLTDRIRTPVMQAYHRFKNRKMYRYFTCPSCKSKSRVPRGRGNVTITCGRCGNHFSAKA